LTLDVSNSHAQANAVDQVHALRETLAAYRGGGLSVQLMYCRPGATGRLLLGEDWRVQPTDELLKRLRHLLGAEMVQVSYQRFVPPRLLARASEQPPRLAVVG